MTPFVLPGIFSHASGLEGAPLFHVEHFFVKSLAHAVAFLAQAFVSGLWQGLALVALVALSVRLLPRLSPSARFVVWTATFLVIAALPMLSTHAVGTHARAALHVSPWVAVGITALWAVLALFRLFQLAAQAVRLRGIWKRAIPVEISAETSALLATAERRTELCTSTDVDAPSVIGFFAPRLLVPATLMPELTDGELRQIILHECEHLRRRDDWINLAQKLALALFPLNPALLWMDRRLGLERELACDAGVVARLSSPFDYAHCLTRLAEHRLHSHRVALALSAWSRRSELSQRVHLLLKPMRILSPLQMRASLAVLGIGLVAGSLEMARVPGLIAFTEAVPVAMAQNVIPAAARIIPASYSPSQPVQAERTAAKVHHRTQSLRASIPTAKLAVAKPAEQPAVEMAEATAPATSAIQAVAHNGDNTAHAVLASTTQQRDPRHRLQVSDAMADDAQDMYLLNDASARARYAAVRFGDGWLIIQL
jgi:beta-lactamase regulating signal transducer with metallopeptidase domain